MNAPCAIQALDINAKSDNGRLKRRRVRHLDGELMDVGSDVRAASLCCEFRLGKGEEGGCEGVDGGGKLVSSDQRRVGAG